MTAERQSRNATTGRSWSPRSPRDQSWALVEQATRFELITQAGSNVFVGADADRLSIRRSWVWRQCLQVRDSSGTQRFYGLKRGDGKSIRLALERFLVRASVSEAVSSIVAWKESVEGVVASHTGDRRWISEQTIGDLESGRPEIDALVWFRLTKNDEIVETLSDVEVEAVHLMATNFRSWIATVNEQIVESELISQRDFFDHIETSPLSDEQARAVICFDNRVNVVASAGSGKTSVMVARAAYAIHRGFVSPDRVLLLAFNKSAAVELQERVDRRLSALGLSTRGLKASTFHSFGLGVIGEAMGVKPRLASWLDGGQDVGMVMRIVDELRDRSADFRFGWDVFRLLYAPLNDDPAEDVESDSWDKQERRTGLETFNGEVVKSQGERLIADWLYLNGVNYAYEKPYSLDVATATHSQYRPDFYYPDIDAWHEHWAIGYDGNPPKSFTGYAEGMKWKRALHAEQGTTLVETEWARIVDASGFAELAKDLERLGLSLDWNPERFIKGAQPVKHQDLARLIRTFMAHVKSNSLTRDAIAKRIESSPKRSHHRSRRTERFLNLYWQIHDEWEQRLAADGSVDFEDMLVRAAAHVENGDASPQYDLVLVDEFQDASQARARLVAALVNPRDRFLLAVGDDWQAINRFAGADISVMTDFEHWFGRGHTLQLQTTFRCTQEICDVSSAFVSKNPRQLRKRVKSIEEVQGDRVLLRYATSSESVEQTIREWLDELQRRVDDGEVMADREDVVSVMVLGRYNFDKDLVPKWTGKGVEVTFRTVHGSKGLEADFVVVPNMSKGKFGFPSQIADDPVLELAMSEAEDFEHSEERRLFYVALTRARRQAMLIGVSGKESGFLTELITDGLIEIDPNGHVPPVVCSECGEGVMVPRRGPYSEFFGCSTFPRCRNTMKTLAPKFN